MMKIICSLILALTMSLSGVEKVQAENCQAILFQSGAFSHTVQGMAPPDDGICYEITASAGQTADITIAGNNVMFSIDGVVDAQDSYSFVTEKKIYKIFVGQLMRSVSKEPFALKVTIK